MTSETRSKKIRFLCDINEWKIGSVTAGAKRTSCTTTVDDSLSLNLERLKKASHLASSSDAEQVKESLIQISYLNCSTISEETSEADQKEWLVRLFDEWIEATVVKNDYLPLLDWRLFSEMLDSKSRILRQAAAESLKGKVGDINSCDPLFLL